MLNYCIVKQRIGAITEDTPDDDDRYPDYTSVFGQVVFAPTMANGSAYKITDEEGVVHTVPATRITAQIINGEISHEGKPGLPLFAAGPNANPSTIVYTATYTNLTAAGLPITLNNITFRAVPGETIDLSSYTPVAGAPTPGIIQGPPGHSPFIGQNGNWWIGGTDTGVAATSPLVHSYTELTEAFEENTMRVKALEAMNGVSPESPVDGQTANLISQSGSLSNTAVRGMTTPNVTSEDQETATLGPDLIASTGWVLGDGWSGNFEDGFTKTPGGTGVLRWNPPFSTGTDIYLVEWQWDGTATHQDAYSGYDVYFGEGYAGITYQGAGNSAKSYSRAIASEKDGYLVFMPWDTFEGRIHSVSVRKVDGAAKVGMGWRTSENTRGGELRFGSAAAQSVFLGINSGRYNITGHRNAAVGAYSMANNVTGFFNAAIGWGALQQNISGTRNTALGYNSLGQNTAGDRNVAIGPFALTRNTTGQRNVAVGTDVLWRNVTGSDNVGIGYLTQTELRTGFSNIAIGKYAMRHTHGATYGGTQHNVAIGEETLGHVLGYENIAIGKRAAARHMGNGIVAIGTEALEYNTNSGSQTAIGRSALRYFTGGRNTALGHGALAGVQGESTGERNVSVGDNSGLRVTSGSMNTIVGPSAGSSMTSGSRNIILGFAAGGGLYNDGDDQLDIGTTIYGDLDKKRIGVGRAPHQLRGILHLRPSTGEVGDVPIKLMRGPLVESPETGALEFFEDKLYFSTANGVRREIAFVSTEPEPASEPTE